MGSFIVLYFETTGTSYIFLTGPSAGITEAYYSQHRGKHWKHLKDGGRGGSRSKDPKRERINEMEP